MLWFALCLAGEHEPACSSVPPRVQVLWCPTPSPVFVGAAVFAAALCSYPGSLSVCCGLAPFAQTYLRPAKKCFSNVSVSGEL